MSAKPKIELQLTDTGVLGTLPCSTLRLRAYEPADDAEETILAILREGAALRPGPRFGGEAKALLIRDAADVPRYLPLGYTLALGQVAGRLCEMAGRGSARNEPVSVWYTHGHSSPTKAVRIHRTPLRRGAEREQIIFSSRMTP